MAEQKYLEQAKAEFNTLCRTLDNENWKYKKKEEELTIECGARGDDLPMDLVFRVNADKRLVTLFSHLPFAIQDDKRLDLAIGISALNNVLVDGCFDYDIKSGHIFFRMTNSFVDSTLGEEVYGYMLYCACRTIDDYNDKFLMLAKGMMSMEQFLKDVMN